MFKKVFATAIFLMILCGLLSSPSLASRLHPACNVSCQQIATDGYRSLQIANGGRAARGRLVAKTAEPGKIFAKSAKKSSRPTKLKIGRSTSATTGYGGTVFGPSNLVARARAYLGQTARQIGVRSTLWCSAFLRHLTNSSGVDDTAKSWLKKPHVQAKVGAIAVLSRGRRGGHVGVVSGFDQHGNPILISGNHGHRVGEGTYSARRVLAYVSI